MIVIHLGQGLLPASSDLPGGFGRAGLERPPIWSCSGRGLPSLPCRHGSWWALTPPLHPYPSPISWTDSWLLDWGDCRIPLRRVIGKHRIRKWDGWGAVPFLWHFPGIAPSGRYPASCPMEPGLSSALHPLGAI